MADLGRSKMPRLTVRELTICAFQKNEHDAVGCVYVRKDVFEQHKQNGEQTKELAQ